MLHRNQIETKSEPDAFSGNCPVRELLDRIADK